MSAISNLTTGVAGFAALGIGAFAALTTINAVSKMLQCNACGAERNTKQGMIDHLKTHRGQKWAKQWERANQVKGSKPVSPKWTNKYEQNPAFNVKNVKGRRQPRKSIADQYALSPRLRLYGTY